MNIREVVRLPTSWDDESDEIEELHKLLVPVLIHALDYDIQTAAVNTVSAVQSGVSKVQGLKIRCTFFNNKSKYRMSLYAKTNQAILHPNLNNP